MRRVWLAALLVSLLTAGTAAAAPRTRPVPQPLQIWPLGDSITQGALGPSKGVPGGYRGFLDLSLEAAGVQHEFIGSMQTNATAVLQSRGQAAHDGHPAFFVGDVTAGVNGVVRAHSYSGGHWITGLRPDLVLLHIGTNDVLYRVDPQRRFPTRDGRVDVDDPAQRARFVADLTVRLERLVDTVHRLRPDAAIVLATIAPVGSDKCDPLTPEYARSVRELALRERLQGARIRLADVWSAYTRKVGDTCEIVPGLLSADRVHPTSAGYAVMAAEFQEAIAAVSG